MPTNARSLPRYALQGRVVTMDDQFTVLDRGRVYISDDRIAAVAAADSEPPPAFADAPVLQTRGTIYPGLIELHNHLSYDALPLWNVPRKYTNRAQWRGIDEYRQRVTEPLKILGRRPGYLEAIVRYVECKCLLSGVTTSQGIGLSSQSGITRYYKGIVRNVERADADDLPPASTSIADIEATDAKKFLQRLQDSTCTLLHLSEGTDESARRHFQALQLADGTWALAPSLAGIHCAALKPLDFMVLRDHGVSMIWSPLSNLLLYGATANVRAASDAGVRMGIGSDWSLSGSKNLLEELKVAKLVSDQEGGVFSNRDLVAMATRNAAQILGWEAAVGTLEANRRADLVVVKGHSVDPYTEMVQATETDISLVVIDGVPRYGTAGMMSLFGPGTEQWRVGGAERVLNLAQDDADPVTGALPLREAQDRLRDGLGRLPEIAQEPLPRDLAAVGWTLLLDEDEPQGVVQRPYLDGEGQGLMAARAVPRGLVQLIPLELDPLTLADDHAHFDTVRAERNLPDYVKEGLPASYV